MVRAALTGCLVLLPLTSCGVGTTCAPPGALCDAIDGRTVRYTDEPQIERIILSCCDPELSPEGTCSGFGEWWGDVVLEGTANRVVVTVLPQTSEDWSESHTLTLVDRDPAGHWEVRFAEWSVANVADCDGFTECADRYQASARSLVPCTDPISRVRFVVEVYKGADEPIDCVTWGSVYPRPPEGCRDAVDEGVLQ